MPVSKSKVQTKTVKSAKKVVKVATTKLVALSVPVYSLAGKETGTLALPKEIFGVKVNKNLLSQALRVYMTNQKTFTSGTKGRGDVEGSTVKIYNQKGTGRARHGAIRAPIFVGGGIVFGPQPRKIRLELPTRMKKAALISALSSKMSGKKIAALSGLEKASGKTKEVISLLKNITGTNKSSSTLIVIAGKAETAVRAIRNIPQTDILQANLINAHEVLKHDMLFLTKDAVEALAKPKEEKGPMDLSSK